ncbi:MAG: hypothetical protein K2Q21_11975 [Chitinophagaceae bacterium]|nr:hypothetical protein [Chitinophagaceae bacterium]
MKQKLIIAAFTCVLMMAALRWQGASLKTTVSTRGIVDLEMATQPRQVSALMDVWDLSVVKMNIWIDFLFIVSYVAFLALAAEAVSAKWKNNAMKMMGLTLARIAVVAGVLDIGENLLMLQTIAGNFTVLSLQMTHYFATIKFTLAAIVLIYLLVSIPVSLRNTKP